MKAKFPIILQLLLLIAMATIVNINTPAQNMLTGLKPPVAKPVPKSDTTNGDTRVDNYFWLREKKNPEVISYLEAENAYTEAVMKPTADLQQKLYTEMLARIKQTDQNVPYKLGDYYYYTRTIEGQQYPIYARKHGSMDAKEEITLDLNEMAKGLKFMAVGAYAVSDDNNLLAYTTDSTGYRQYTLHVKDLRTGQMLPEKIERVDNVAWAQDNKTIFYVTEDDVTKRSDKFFRHTVGTDQSELLYEEKDELYDIGAYRTRDRALIVLQSESKTTADARYIPADKPMSALKLVLSRENDHKYFIDHRGDLLYVRTNKNAKNYRLMTAPMSDPGVQNWKEIVAHQPQIKLDDFDLFANYLVLSERTKGLPTIRIIDLRNQKAHELDFPEPVYNASLDANREFNTDTLRFRYQSLTTPSSVFDYDMNKHTRVLLKQTPVLGGYDPANYTAERVYATASDGTKIPMSVVYRKGLKRDGKNPLLLYGYGSYGISTDPNFNSNRVSLLDRGVVYAIAHIRGGGELGEDWREAGRMMQKKNTFTDFIACAEHLIKEKYTSSDRLAIQGGSAGGLLMGAVVNMRPDLFKAVLAQVPFVDVVNTMLDASLPLTTGEYLEWGNPNEKAAYDYIKSYSPYDNVAAKAYPTMLVKVSLNDSQVPYWEGTKFVAKLRALKTDNNPVLLKVNMGAGHGGSSGRYDALHDLAFDYAFLLTQLGAAN
ncbi:MAG: S9 family peptidase [Pyrinomonadaceae bacterium]